MIWQFSYDGDFHTIYKEIDVKKGEDPYNKFLKTFKGKQSYNILWKRQKNENTNNRRCRVRRV